jgi:DNA mismatch repair ATPase MutS
MCTKDNRKWGLCYADVSTGLVRSVEGESTDTLRSELERLSPAELLVPASSDRETYAYDSKESSNLLCLDGRNRRLYGR